MTQEELYSYLEKVFGLTGVKYVTPEKRYTLMKGIVDELAKKAEKSTIIEHTDANVTINLIPNVIHHITGATSIAITSVEDTFKECFIQFVSGESAPTLTMPESVKWANGQAPTLEANMTYQISIVKLCACCVGYKEVSNEQA